MSDPLLVGELKNFPPEALQKIDAAGGLKNFLLESLRFVMHDSLIGLASHAVCFQHTIDSSACSMDDSEPKGSSHLNPTAKEFLPQQKHLSLNDSSESYDQSSTTNRPVLPSPYVYFLSNLNYAFGNLQDMPGTEPDVQDTDYPDSFSSIPPNAFSTEVQGSDNNYINFKEDICSKNKTVQVRAFKKHFGFLFFIFYIFIFFFTFLPIRLTVAKMLLRFILLSIQTLWGNKGTRDDVAINTEPYTPFEKNRVSLATCDNLLLFIYLQP